MFDAGANTINKEIIKTDVDESVVESVYRKWQDHGFPYYPTDDESRTSEFQLLMKFDRSGLYKHKDKMISWAPHGLALAWSYMPHSWGIKCGTMRTPMEIWNDEEHFKKAIRKLLTGTFWDKKEHHKIGPSDIRAILMRYSGTQIVSNFRPTAAAVVYDKFLEKFAPLFGTKAGTTWDMSCGYGGRLLGSIAAGVNYIGTDPCTETFKGLEQIRDEWKLSHQTVELHQLGSEVFRPDKNRVDLCFTSPPYFDWEKYSDEETQSYKQFETVELWTEGFLRKTIENCYYGLKPGGVMVMNGANTKRIKTFEKDIVRLGIETGMTHIDQWKLQLSTSQKGQMYKTEPMFIFRK